MLRPLLWTIALGALGLSYFLVEPAIVMRLGVRPLDPERTRAVTIAPGGEPSVVSALAPHLPRLVDRLKVPGLSVAVVSAEGTLFSGSAGWAHLIEEDPLTPDLALPLGRVSEIATVTLAAVLLEEGALHLDTPVGIVMRDLPPRYGQLSLRQLLAHEGGVPGYGTCLCLPIWERFNRQAFPSLDVAAGVRFLGEPLETAPGKDAVPSAYGYTLAGMALADMAGAPFRWALDAQVTERFGLASLATVQPDERQFYLAHRRGAARSVRLDPSDRLPGAGLAATARDLARLGMVWAGGAFSVETKESFLSPQPLGWTVEGPFLIARSNDADGAGYLLVDRARQRAIALLFNGTMDEPAVLPGLARQLLDESFD